MPEHSRDGQTDDLDTVVSGDAESVTCQEEKAVLYSVEDTPSLPLSILLGFQHYLTAFGSTLSVPLILAGPLCLEGDSVGVSEVIGTVFFASGIATLLQTTVGIRLPIVQGTSVAFLAPTFSILSLPEWKCPATVTQTASNTANDTAAPTSMLLVLSENNTATRLVEMGSAEHREIWQARLREIQGAILLASLTQVVVGFSGLLSVLLRYLGPLVVAPTVCLIGLSLFDAAADKSSQQWWIAILYVGTVVLIVLFSQGLHRLLVPLPSVSVSCKKGLTFTTTRLPLFGLFPVLLAMILCWLICLTLTVTDVLPSDPEGLGYNARTDVRSGALRQAAWIRVPYPGQWGTPTVSLSAVLGMIAGVLASLIESVGDYYACARLSGAPPPPTHALNRGQWGTPTVSLSAVLGMIAGVLASLIESVGDYYACARLSGAPPPPMHALNRGIGVEGIACIIAGALGSGNGTTSFSQNVAAIGITKVASRRVVQTAGVLLILMGCLGKVGALFVTIPDPVVGGMLFAMFAMICAVGLSNLRYVDLRKPRNMCVLGLSLFVGLAVPRWVSAHKEAVSTGSSIVDQILEVLLSTSMFVGGFVGFALDNLLPGTAEERGVIKWKKESVEDGPQEGATGLEIYDLPLIDKCLSRFPLWSRLSFCPPARKMATRETTQLYRDQRAKNSKN